MLSPEGATVRSPDRIRDKVTGQLREVDASIRYQVGSAAILITIECRRRDAVQDDTWLEQLAKKREKIGAAVTIAVSASGFSSSAARTAEQSGIELRTLKEVTDEEIASWANSLRVEAEVIEWSFVTIEVCFDTDEPAEIDPAVDQLIRTKGYEAEIAHRSDNQAPLTLRAIGEPFVEHGDFPRLPDIQPFGIVVPEQLHYVATTRGPKPVRFFKIMVHIRDVQRPLPIRRVLEYATLDKPIVQVAEFDFRHRDRYFTVGVVRNAQRAQ